MIFKNINRWNIFKMSDNIIPSGNCIREAEVIGTSRPAPEGTWTQGGGIEIPCKYILKGNKAYKKNVRNAFAKK